MTFTLDDKDQAKIDQLWKRHLRFPGTVTPRIVRLLRLNTYNPDQLSAIRLEWLKLCGEQA